MKIRIRRQLIRPGIKIGRKYTYSFLSHGGKRFYTGKAKNSKYWSWIN